MEIATDRLLLREFVRDDWRAVFAYQNDPRYLQVIDRTPRTEADSREFVEMFMAWAVEAPRGKFQFAVTLRETGELIGNCGIRRHARYGWDADIGYEYSADHWGKGYATEAANAVLSFGFRELGIHRASANCNAANAASIHVLRKLGMQLEVRIRDGDSSKGQWWDRLVWGILESEWRERQP
jgi:[ribosomal protein S5]-alanine N-acetyltransferase